MLKKEIELRFSQGIWHYCISGILKRWKTTTNDLITVTVKLFADLRQYGAAIAVINLPKGGSVNSVIEKYKIPRKEKRLITLVNRIRQENDCNLKDGDIIAIFPLIGGG